MIPVYICEDDNLIRVELEKLISGHIAIRNYNMEVAFSTADPTAFLDKVTFANNSGVYFLDVDLRHKKYDGFLLGNEIRQRDTRGFIIYVTAFTDLAFKTFQYHIEALDYISKENLQKMSDGIRNSLDTIMSRINNRIVDDRSNAFAVKQGDIIRYIAVSDIYYFETSVGSHRIIMNTENEKVSFIGSLSDIEKRLGKSFIRTHDSYLVNTDKIESIDTKHNRILLLGGMSCLISRKMKKEIIEKLKC